MSAEETLRFIEDYRIRSVLWDTKCRNYSNKAMRNKALLELGGKYNMDIQGVKNKIKSLRSYFAKEKQKGLKRKSDCSDDEEYISQWFAYNSLLFIKDSITQKETKETGEIVEFETTISEEPRTEEFVRALTEFQPSSSSRNSNNSFSTPTNNMRIMKKSVESPEDEETYNLVKVASKHRSPAVFNNKEECTIFGEMVIAKIRKLNPRNQAIAQHRINNFLFTLEMQELDAADPSSSHNTTTTTTDSTVITDYLNFQ